MGRGSTITFWQAPVLVGISVLLGMACIGLLWSPRLTESTHTAKPLVVYCAAVMLKPVERLAAEFSKQSGVNVVVEPGGSGALLAKLRAAPNHGDLFLSAEPGMLQTARQDHPPRVREILPVGRIRPVLALAASAKDKVQSLDDLKRADVKVVLANPELAAIGQIARQLLGPTGHWPRLEERIAKEGGQVSFVGTVNEVATALKLGAAEAGIIWDVTAKQYELMIVPCELLESAPQQIELGVLSSALDPTCALRFARYLTARDRGRIVFEEYYFKPIPHADAWVETPSVTLAVEPHQQAKVMELLDSFQQREGAVVAVMVGATGRPSSANPDGVMDARLGASWSINPRSRHRQLLRRLEEHLHAGGLLPHLSAAGPVGKEQNP